MKLSEAALLSIGAVENDPSLWLRDNPPGGCFLGTALYSMGVRAKDLLASCLVPRQLANTYWPWLRVERQDLYTSKDVFSELSCRHFAGASRESLAAWVATIEPQEEPATQPVEEVANESTRQPA